MYVYSYYITYAFKAAANIIVRRFSKSSHTKTLAYYSSLAHRENYNPYIVVEGIGKKPLIQDHNFSHSCQMSILCKLYLNNITFSLSLRLFSGPCISTATFCKIFPFHVMFNRQMKIVQVGKSVPRVIPR